MLAQVISPVLAAGGGGDTFFDLNAIQVLLVSLAGLALVWVGIVVIGRSKKADYSDTVRIGFNAVVGIVLVAAGAGAVTFAVLGRRILDFLGITGG
ncbi:MAG: hypothetical protein GEU93_02430 [Propionibacteriales bacterium]|nr:hypothetical protein [Propionibacteriales bacterium]